MTARGAKTWVGRADVLDALRPLVGETMPRFAAIGVALGATWASIAGHVARARECGDLRLDERRRIVAVAPASRARQFVPSVTPAMRRRALREECPECVARGEELAKVLAEKDVLARALNAARAELHAMRGRRAA